MDGIFKANDIRGIFPDSIHAETAEAIGRAFAEFTGSGKVAVGKDMRLSSDELEKGLIRGLTAAGTNVIRLGRCSTPMFYFAAGMLKTDGGIMITASHNPGEWNGFKFCLADAVPVGKDNGMKEIESRFMTGKWKIPLHSGIVEDLNIAGNYGKYIRQFAKFDGKKLKVVCDFGNGMGSAEIAGIRDLFELIPLYEKPDGRFPNHEANPLKTETLQELCRKVRETGADFGAALDGDADRCGFVDETGRIVSMDLSAALIAGEILKTNGPGPVLYDLRSSHAVPEYIAECGGTPVMTPVGHSFIKKIMRETGAVFGGELSGHCYFRENFCAESSALAVIRLANLLIASGRKFSELTASFRRYYSTGELNFKVTDIMTVVKRVRQIYEKKGKWCELDGISGEFGSWRFNLRSSNTEPLLRLILEADTPERMAAERDQLISVISGK